MRPTEVAESLRVCIKARQPVMIYGQPGIGKSDIVRQVADELKKEVIDVRLSQMDPVDLRGIPTIGKDGSTVWSAPNWFPRKKDQLLFFDEMNSAAQSVFAASYQIFLDRCIGDHVLPPDTVIIGAGNNVSDRALVNTMPTPLKNRLLHIDMEINLDDWATWAVKHGLDHRVLGFVRFRPNLLSEFSRVNATENKKKDEAKKHHADQKDLKGFATPRSWSFVSRLLAAKPSPSVEFGLYAGCVGEGPATEFVSYLECERDLPDLDDLLKNPDKIKLPDERKPAVMYALATGLAVKATQANFDRVCRFLARIPVEFQIMTVKDAVMRDPQISNTKSFNEWSVKNSDVMI